MYRNAYEEAYSRATNPETREAFWREQSSSVDWIRAPTTILDQSRPNFPRWFKDGVLNMSYNCIDRHLKDLPDQLALIWESPVSNQSKTYTFTELHYHVSKMAGLMRSFGIEKGDRVIIYLPMIPEACFSMLACARIGF